MKFNIEDYKGDYVMHCKTEEEANDFCRYLDSVGRTWSSNSSYINNTRYDSYWEHTAYNFNQGTYGDIISYRKWGATILEWSDFMNKEFTKADLKTGDVVKFRNNRVGIWIFELQMIKFSNDGYTTLDDAHEDLTDIHFEEWDVVAVRRPNQPHECAFKAFEYEYGTLVYERKEVEEMTLAEVCKLLGKEIKIVK